VASGVLAANPLSLLNNAFCGCTTKCFPHFPPIFLHLHSPVPVKLRVERAKPMMDEKVDKPKSKHFYGLFGLVFTWLVSGLLGVYVSQGIYEEMARESDQN